MKNIITKSLLLLGITTFPQLGQAMIAPHWQAASIDCIDCHANHIGPKTECSFCHNNSSGAPFTKNSAPEMNTHSSAIMGSETYGVWQLQCVDCHDPHVSGQCDNPLITGTFTSYVAGSGTTTFTIDSLTINDNTWQNPTDWQTKSGQERGLIMVVQGMLWDAESNAYQDFSSEIINATSSSITVLGEINEMSTVRDFTILYGQYVKGTISDKTVRFAGPNDFATDESATGIDPTPSGICQVCHSQTRFWRNDGSGAAHFSGENCTTCHEHEQGFKPSCNACHGYPPVLDSPGQLDGLVWSPEATGSTTAGAHGAHVIDNGISCESCHYEGMPVTPINDDYQLQMGFYLEDTDTSNSSYDGQILNPVYGYQATNGTTVTTNGSLTCLIVCHSDGTYIATGDMSGFLSPPWNSTVSTGCTACHQYPPSYGQDEPKSNDHYRHVTLIGYNCSMCHAGTTTDGSTINPTGNHANGRYDVVGGPSFPGRGGQMIPLELVYEFSPGGGSCSTNSCHDYWGFSTPISWGNTYLRASPSITQGDASNKVDFSVHVTDCGSTTCNEPYFCTFDWGDGSVDENITCQASHIYPAPGDYTVTWNVWDSKHHSLSADKANTVTAVEIEEVITPAIGARVDPSTGLVSVTVPATTETGKQIVKVYCYWGDYLSNAYTPPFEAMEHSYKLDGTYRIRVTVYDANRNKYDYTSTDEPSLEVTVVNP